MTPSRGSKSRSRSSSKERLLSKLADAATVVDTPVDEDEIKGESIPLISVSQSVSQSVSLPLPPRSPLPPPHFDSDSADWAHAPRVESHPIIR